MESHSSVFLFRLRRHPGPTITDTLFPYTRRIRSGLRGKGCRRCSCVVGGGRRRRAGRRGRRHCRLGECVAAAAEQQQQRRETRHAEATPLYGISQLLASGSSPPRLAKSNSFGSASCDGETLVSDANTCSIRARCSFSSASSVLRTCLRSRFSCNPPT